MGGWKKYHPRILKNPDAKKIIRQQIFSPEEKAAIPNWEDEKQPDDPEETKRLTI